MVASLDGFLELVWDGSFPLRYRLHVVLHVDVDGIHRGASHTLEHFTNVYWKSVPYLHLSVSESYLPKRCLPPSGMTHLSLLLLLYGPSPSGSSLMIPSFTGYSFPSRDSFRLLPCIPSS